MVKSTMTETVPSSGRGGTATTVFSDIAAFCRFILSANSFQQLERDVRKYQIWQK